MSFHVPANQSVCWSIYWATVQEDCSKRIDDLDKTCPGDFVRLQKARVERAFDRGEPIWMIVQELKIAYETRGYALPPEKTPRQLAKRVVRM